MSRTSHDRHFPVRPNLDQLKHQAKDLLRAIRQGDRRRDCGVTQALSQARHRAHGCHASRRAGGSSAKLRSPELAASGYCLPHDRCHLAW